MILRTWQIPEDQLKCWFKSLREMHKAIRRKNKLIYRLREENRYLSMSVNSLTRHVAKLYGKNK